MSKLPVIKQHVPITPSLERLLNPRLHNKEPIFTRRLELPAEGEKVYLLTDENVAAIQRMRGNVVDLHPGMGGIAPDKLIQMLNEGAYLTSLDYMITRGCNFECTWCFASSGPKAKEYLPFNTLERLTGDG